VWWIRYSHRSRDYRESSGGERETDAWRRLKERWKQIGKGRFVGPAEEKVTVNSLLDALEIEYETNARRSRSTLPSRLLPLREALGDKRAVDVTGAEIERYEAARLTAKSRRADPLTGQARSVAPATINRKLAALRTAFRRAVEQNRLSSGPVIRLLTEQNAREGFIEPATFERIARALPGELQDFARSCYAMGWRKGEVQTLAWSDVDRAHSRITLRRAHSKNGEPRVLALVGDLGALIERRWQARECETPDRRTALSAFVFHRKGRPVGDFRKAWKVACQTAGVGGSLFHDLRRSAVRNFEKAGVSQAVAMNISGHKTASVYRRYRIVDDRDIADALARTQETVRQAAPATVMPLRVSDQPGR
jgi:integrase